MSKIIYLLIQENNTILIDKNVNKYFDNIGNNYYDSSILDITTIPVCKGEYKINDIAINVIHVVGPDLTGTSQNQITSLRDEMIHATTDMEYETNYSLLYNIFFTLYEKIFKEALDHYNNLKKGTEKDAFRLILPIISSGIFAKDDSDKFLICKIFINVYYNLIIDTYSDKSEFVKNIRIITYNENINNDIIIALLTNMNYYMININIVDTNIVAGTNDEKARLLHHYVMK
jgi:hypothetical protein